MTDRLTKGFNLEQTLLFIDSAFSAQERDRIHARLPEELKARLRALRTGDWYPIADQVAFLDAMVAVVSDPEEGERKARALGRFISDAATGTFMRLVLKVLTPPMFLKKAGDIWPRMFSFGVFECDPSGFGQGTAVMTLRDVDGFAHVAPVSAGWMEGVFAAMGFADVRVRYGPLGNGAASSGWRFDIDWS
ncbi:MAG: hypothetical protein HYV09_38940 [Deltaproteobacteria bacterium]|nr:hypothetical protein [Deltaproteobacteria bacterium]